MRINEIKDKYFLSSTNKEEFYKNMKNLSIIQLKKIAVSLNELAEEKRKKSNDELSEKMKKYLKCIETFKESDFSLVFDKLESIKYNKKCTMDKNSSIFSNNARYIVDIIDTLNDEELNELRELLYDNYSYYLEDKKLSKVYKKSILKQYNK